jgi:DNA replication and repair protein RecF
MYLEKLKLVNFKNYGEAEITLSPKINCFVGDNGVGKTNILDAIHYLSLCKSYFNSVDQHSINFDENFFFIEGSYQLKGEQENIHCSVMRGKKKSFKRNKKEYKRLADHIGLLPIVMISPFDSTLITEGSDERRKFIDTVISQYDHEYLHSLMRYNKALQQRNKLLKDMATQQQFDRETLTIYDEQLIQQGNSISEKRQQFTRELVPVFNQYYETISIGNEHVDLIYRSQLIQSDYRRLLTLSLDKDRIVQYTTAGTHKDDLVMNLSEHPIKQCGSQGQQKSYLVALKFAKFDFIKKISGIKPILLLDDIFDKFDKNRVKQIIKLVSDNHFGQIFITDTNQVRLDQILEEISLEHKIFSIDKSVITEIT